MIERSKLHHAGFLIKLKQTKKNTATLILTILNLNLYQILSNVIFFRNFNLTSFWTRAGKHFGIINSNVTLISWPSRCLKNNLQPKPSKQSIIRYKSWEFYKFYKNTSLWFHFVTLYICLKTKIWMTLVSKSGAYTVCGSSADGNLSKLPARSLFSGQTPDRSS